MSICRNVYLSVYVCLSLRLSGYFLCVYVSVCQSICFSICLCVIICLYFLSLDFFCLCLSIFMYLCLVFDFFSLSHFVSVSMSFSSFSLSYIFPALYICVYVVYLFLCRSLPDFPCLYFRLFLYARNQVCHIISGFLCNIFSLVINPCLSFSLSLNEFLLHFYSFVLQV